jgi:hypothetical protein
MISTKKPEHQSQMMSETFSVLDSEKLLAEFPE